MTIITTAATTRHRSINKDRHNHKQGTIIRRPKLTTVPGAGTKVPELRGTLDPCPSPPPFWVSVELVVKPSAKETLFSDVLLLPITQETLRRELLLLLLLLILLLVLVLSRARPVVPVTAGTS